MRRPGRGVRGARVPEPGRPRGPPPPPPPRPPPPPPPRPPRWPKLVTSDARIRAAPRRTTRIGRFMALPSSLLLRLAAELLDDDRHRLLVHLAIHRPVKERIIVLELVDVRGAADAA